MVDVRVGYAVENPQHLSRVVEAAAAVMPHVARYTAWLRRFDTSMELPRTILFVDLGAATRVLSSLPLPAWTNTDSRIVFVDPIPTDWSETFTKAIGPGIPPEIAHRAADYYATLGPMDVASIVGHELTHHLSAFDPDATSPDWFEEGFCFYLSRARVLDGERLRAVSEVEALMLDAGATAPPGRLGRRFGVQASGRVDEILVDYWRATRIVSQLADGAGDQGRALLEQYRAWRSVPYRTEFLDAATPWGSRE